MQSKTELVTITIDGVEVKVPKGTNLIEAAKSIGIEIPYYCYHPNLSIAGNCRMCQVQVEGSPKLTIACNTGATAGMVVRTQKSSKDVAEAQRATLEFLLINHPLDCTVCDQAGHCKLQDYYFQYNAKASRFVEDKVHKVKAEVFGPEVIYDGERCIVCTRCVRFCDEVTATGELGVLNRGDHSVIGINENRELTNALSGTVVDLCPVGALTHRRWRFNTRIWYTKEVDTICTGCSTGCNAKVAERDGQIVHVKARHNPSVNKEWMCDEGRYGFNRFQPPYRLTAPVWRHGERFEEVSWEAACKASEKLLGTTPGATANDVAMFLSPFLTVEELWVALRFAEVVLGISAPATRVAMQLRRRTVEESGRMLISPDYAPNAKAAVALGLITDAPDFRAAAEARYEELLEQVRARAMKRVLLIGEDAVLARDVDDRFMSGMSSATVSIGCSTSSVLARSHHSENGAAHLRNPFACCSVVFPGRTVNEKDGVMINGQSRVQRLRAALTAPFGTLPEWMILKQLAERLGKPILPAEVSDDRALFREVASRLNVLSGVTLMKIGETGYALEQGNDRSKGTVGKDELRA